MCSPSARRHVGFRVVRAGGHLKGVLRGSSTTSADHQAGPASGADDRRGGPTISEDVLLMQNPRFWKDDRSAPVRSPPRSRRGAQAPRSVAEGSPRVAIRQLQFRRTAEALGFLPAAPWVSLGPPMGQTRSICSTCSKISGMPYSGDLEETISTEIVATRSIPARGACACSTDPRGAVRSWWWTTAGERPGGAEPLPRRGREHEGARRRHRLRGGGHQARPPGGGRGPDRNASGRDARRHALAPGFAPARALELDAAAGLRWPSGAPPSACASRTRSPRFSIRLRRGGLRRHFEPSWTGAFDDVLAEHYPEGVAFMVNGRPVEKRRGRRRRPRSIEVRRRGSARPRRSVRRASSGARSWKTARASPSAPRQGHPPRLDRLGVTLRLALLVAGLVEAPASRRVLDVQQEHFVRAGRRGMTIPRVPKGHPGSRLPPLAERARRGTAKTPRRGGPRALSKGTSRPVLVDLAKDYPALTALVERRAGASAASRPARTVFSPRAPSASDRWPPGDAEAGRRSHEPGRRRTDVARRSAGGPGRRGGATGADRERTSNVHLEPAARPTDPGGLFAMASPSTSRISPTTLSSAASSSPTVWVNMAHPAYARAVASRAEGYHVALTVALSLAPLAAEPGKSQDFLTEFLAGGRGPRPRPPPSSRPAGCPAGTRRVAFHVSRAPAGRSGPRFERTS